MFPLQPVIARLSGRYSAKSVLVNDRSEESAAGGPAGKERGSRMYEMQEPRPWSSASLTC
jgi:hypothetical protein